MKNLFKLSTLAALGGALFTVAHADVSGKWQGTVRYELEGGVKAVGSTYTLVLDKNGRCSATFEAAGTKSKPFTGTWSEQNGLVKLKFAKKSTIAGPLSNPLKVENNQLIATIAVLKWSAKKPAKIKNGEIQTRAITFSRV